MGITFFIPALRGQARFQDDLLRKLNGVSLIQRAIDKARLLAGTNQSIHILTDSEEIALVGRRNDVGVFFRPGFTLEAIDEDSDLQEYLAVAEQGSEVGALLSPYAPLLEPSVVDEALHFFMQQEAQVLMPVRTVARRVFDPAEGIFASRLLGNHDEHHRLESLAFTLMRPGQLARFGTTPVAVEAFEANDSTFEIETLRDWWVCEKLLQRKRVVFRVIGNKRVGMGHVYRALSLAHELHDHEILFVTDTEHQAAVKAIVRRDYWLGVYPLERVVKEITRLKPDLVINDMLNTRKRDIEQIRACGSLAVSFEDLGPGARCTDLTINELYDVPRFEGNNVFWGRKYFFLREEFALASPHRFARRVSAVMLAFGGTDQHDLARKIFQAIRPLCEEFAISVQIVTGPGYRGYDRLMRQVQNDAWVSLTHDSEVISGLMEQVQVAITSNGRTVYEFAHMNIPAIVIAQHERELTHAFASAENGFVPLGLYRPGRTEKKARQALRRLLTNTSFRKDLHQRQVRYRFNNNKNRVLRLITGLLACKARNGPPIGAVPR